MDQPNYPQQPPYNQFPENNEKQRHGCVTAWLILVIIGNSAVALLYLLGGDMINRALPQEIPSGMMYLLAFAGLLNVVFAISLLQWKRWGFYGFIVSAIAGVLINLSLGLGVGSSFAGLLSIGVLYGILQIKQNGVSAWENME